MLRLWSSILTLLLLVGAARAQTIPPEYRTQFDKGIKLLNEGKNDEGIAAFKRCMELVPTDPTSPYNVACGYSKKGELDAAFEYLNKAADLGFGNTDQAGKSNIVFAGEDADLANARKDPRWQTLIEKMTAMRAGRESLKKKGEEYASKPAIYVPEAIAALPEKPVLVVLHDVRQTKDQVVEGRYKAIADELGYALIAPSGRVLVGDDPAQGMAWFDDAATYLKTPWMSEKTVNESISAFKKEHKVDKNRVYLIGEGVGGLVATSVGVGSPGLYKGVIAINSQLVSQLVSQKAPQAGKMGLRMRLLNDAELGQKELTAGEDFAKVVESWSKSLSSWGIAGSATTYKADANDPKQLEALIVETIKGFAAAAEAVPAGAPK